jgi:hypothetical protein
MAVLCLEEEHEEIRDLGRKNRIAFQQGCRLSVYTALKEPHAPVVDSIFPA